MIKPQYFLFLIGIFSFFCGYSQNYSQYFDGPSPAHDYISVNIDTAKSNIWQIGRPQKKIFDSAATLPNAILTDTVKAYPPNNISTFYMNTDSGYHYGIRAIQWKQKLDMERGHAIGKVEYSIDGGYNWVNVVGDPYVYKFYGYNSANMDSSSKTGNKGFIGTDSAWKDIWLCFDNSFLYTTGQQVLIRYTFKSDSVKSNKEGWMIDNFISHLTVIHTAIPGETEQAEYMRVFPIPTTGIVNIQAKRLEQYHIIEHMELLNSIGQVVEKYGLAPTKFYIDIKNHPDGVYYLKVTTNIKAQTFPVILKR